MKSLVVVGVGALGSHAVLLLRNAGVAIKVVDFDRVEQQNVQSQFHGKSHVGKTKVEALKQAMQFLFGTRLEPVPNKLTADNVEALIGTADLVLDCVDNAQARRVLQACARRLEIPLLHGALAPNGQFGRVVWDEHFQVDDEQGTTGATCENGEHLPFIAIASAYLAHAAQEYLIRGAKIGFSISPGWATQI